MDFLFDSQWIARIIAFLFPNAFFPCDGCIPIEALNSQ